LLSLVAVAGWAAYSGSLPQLPQQVEREGPPREQRSEKANQAISNEAGNSSTVSLQINCNPNCTANQTYKQSDDSALTRGIQKFTEDPIEAITTVIAIANGAFVILLLVQIADSRRSSERQLRAYVFVEKINIFPYPSAPDRISSVDVVIRNFGNTPAYKATIKHESTVFSGLIPKAFCFTFTKNALFKTE
jgi:hypothetical protein